MTKIEFLEPITGSSRKKEDNSFIGSQNVTQGSTITVGPLR